VKHIDIKTERIDPSNPNVEHIETHREGEDGYTPSWKTYEGFEIDYGDQTLTTLEKEALESSEYAKLQFWYLRNEVQMLRADTNKNFNQMAEKQDSTTIEVQRLRADTNKNFNQMAEKQDSTTEEVQRLRADTNKNFNQMAEKYGSIAENLKSTNKEINDTLKETKNGIQGAIEDLPIKLKTALIEGLKDYLDSE
jgi:uncharacterized phage infection (PIP) family protein YhgE